MEGLGGVGSFRFSGFQGKEGTDMLIVNHLVCPKLAV